MCPLNDADADTGCPQCGAPADALVAHDEAQYGGQWWLSGRELRVRVRSVWRCRQCGWTTPRTAGDERGEGVIE